jgi:hypothetical protein
LTEVESRSSSELNNAALKQLAGAEPEWVSPSTFVPGTSFLP